MQSQLGAPGHSSTGLSGTKRLSRTESCPCAPATLSIRSTMIAHKPWSRPRHAALARAIPRVAAAPPVPNNGLQSSAAHNSLLLWASQGNPTMDSNRLVEVRDLGLEQGRGLVAMRDIPPSEVLLSIPFTRVFQSDPEASLHWAADMAIRLLTERHQCAQHQHDPATPPSAWSPWIQALPRQVITPLAYSDDEVAALGDAGVISEVLQQQQYFSACYSEELQPELAAIGCSFDDFLWAVQVFTSRCFFEPSLGRHLAVPGIDMANHSFTPSASVQIRHSEDRCQGMEALLDVCEPPPPSPSIFQLVAGPDGLRADQEVTICYGSQWPNEPFLLLFGFAPDDNPQDAVILFPQLSNLVQSYIVHAAQLGDTDKQRPSTALGSASTDPAQPQLFEAVMAYPSVVEAAESGVFDRLLVTREGLDSRFSVALDVIQQAASACCNQAPGSGLVSNPYSFLSAVCHEKMEELQKAAAASQGSTTSSEAATTAARFRSQKQAILQQVLNGLQLSSAQTGH